MKLLETRPKQDSNAVHGGDQAKTFTQMDPLDRDVELLLMVASLSEITEALDERLQTLELSGAV